jgi:uncharacterized protein
MGFDQYHEPPEELSAQTRTFARMCASLTEEAEAIGWYEQRISVEIDAEAVAIMHDAQGEEFKHFSMDLELLLRRTPKWREIAKGVLFQDGDIVEHGEAAEAVADSDTLVALDAARRRGARAAALRARGAQARRLRGAEGLGALRHEPWPHRRCQGDAGRRSACRAATCPRAGGGARSLQRLARRARRRRSRRG